MTIRRSCLALSILALSACSSAGTTAPASAATMDPTAPAAPPAAGADAAGAEAVACNATPAQGVVGKLATAAVIEQARVSAGAGSARTLKPGQMVTMEFNPARLNLDVDAGNAVTGVRCG